MHLYGDRDLNLSLVFTEITEVLLFSKGPADDWVKRIPQIRHRKTVIKISSRFIRHPMDAVSVGDTVKVRVLDVDQERRKIALTMKL